MGEHQQAPVGAGQAEAGKCGVAPGTGAKTGVGRGVEARNANKNRYSPPKLQELFLTTTWFVLASLQSDIGLRGAEKCALEQQIVSLQLSNERNDRQSRQDATKLQDEMQSVRQRLDRADADLIHSRRENIRLGEQVASLEKEARVFYRDNIFLLQKLMF